MAESHKLVIWAKTALKLTVEIVRRLASRADERQQLLSLRSRALACNLAVIAAFIGLTAAIAVKAAWWWPFLVILGIAGLGYLFGLLNYGVTEADTQDDLDTGHQTRSPVNS